MIDFFKGVDHKERKKIRYIAMIACICIIGLFLLYHMIPWFAQAYKIIVAVLRPLIIGIILCYLLHPAVLFLEKKFNRRSIKRWSKPVSVLLVLLIVITAFSLFFVAVFWTATKQITSIDFESLQAFSTETLNSIDDLINSLQKYLASLNINVSTITKYVHSLITRFVSGSVSSLTSFFFGMIFAIYFLIDGNNIASYWKRVTKALISSKAIPVMKELGQDADRCFSGYIRGQAIDALIVGMITTLLMLVVGMPYALVIGFLTGFGNLIPYVGSFLGYCSVLVVTGLNFNIHMMIIGLVIVAIVMFIDGNLINPRLLANSVNVHPLLVVAALLAGGALGGLVGMLIAVPAGAFLKMQFEKFILFREKNKKTE